MILAPSKPDVSSTNYLLYEFVVNINKSQLLGVSDASYLKWNQLLDPREVMRILKVGFCAVRGCFGT